MLKKSDHAFISEKSDLENKMDRMNSSDEKPKIILINGDKADGETLRRYLSSEYVFEQITDESTIFQKVNEIPPDCIIIGDHPVGSDGLEILNQLVQINFKKPVAYIMLTGHKSIDTAMKSIRTGAHDLIVKNSFSKSSLIRSIRGAIKNARLEYQVKHLAYHDPLTDLWNRQAFWQHLEIQAARARRSNELFGVICVDLDGFKLINDHHGHDIGDELLIQVAHRLRNNVQQGDLVARLGGDGFIILVNHIKHYKNAGKIAHRLKSCFEQPIQIDHKQFSVTASMGISIFPLDGQDPDELVRHSDTAMYDAKRSGRNRFKFFDKKMNQQAKEMISLEDDLKRSVKNNEFVIHYQPIMDQKRNIVGLEALLRWNSPTRGLLGPSNFVPVLENNREMIPVGYWVLETVCKQCRNWLEEDIGPVRVNVNISPAQFKDDRLGAKIQNILMQTNLPSQWLGIEITESSVIDDIPKCIEILNHLRGIGLQIYMDDFGMGYSSLNYLSKFPIQCLKIDRNFVKDIPKDANMIGITQAIITMAKALKLKVVSEGIETQEQMTFLKERICDYFQGYLFSKPLPAEEITKILRGSARAWTRTRDPLHVKQVL